MEQPKRKQIRLGSYDYSQEGRYFVTICTEERKECLGEIKEKKIYLSELGKIVMRHWLNLPNHYPNCKSCEFVIMPNHLHGIIMIDNSIILKDRNVKPHPLSEMIRGFKTFSSKEINKNIENFCWQRSFYDRIIRNDKEYEHVRYYILENPQNWEKDRNNQENLLM